MRELCLPWHKTLSKSRSLLPTPEDDEVIRNNMCTLISRIMYENMDFARLTFDGVVNWHITHDFYKMSRKSVVVSVFVVYHTPTKYPYPQKHFLQHLPPITHTPFRFPLGSYPGMRIKPKR